jgi:hypothetical protein
MRNWFTLLLLLGIAWPAMAAKTMSVEQVEQLLVKLHGKPDGRVAGELEQVELTERVSMARLVRWETDFPGKRTQEALIGLADTAAFLNPPQLDVIPDPPPEKETQQRMLELAVDYVKTTMTRLPNFYATRETTHFENMPVPVAIGTGISNGAGRGMRALRSRETAVTMTDSKWLRSTGAYSAVVTYREGQEVPDAATGSGREKGQPPVGLTTSGEFGPILMVVIGDATRGRVSWLRWEKGTSEPVAVFGYSVPQDLSNFGVTTSEGAKIDEVYPGYHGEIAIDPATGEILRISAVADLPPPHDRVLNALLVEYAPVSIGGSSYICPVRGVAFSKKPVPGRPEEKHDANVPALMRTQLNDVAFTHYHLFRAEVRIVGSGSGKSDAAPTGTAGSGSAQPPSQPQ